jgi:hypothetical protein
MMLMAWLDRINERDARRLGRSLRNNAFDSGRMAPEHLTRLVHDAGSIAGEAAKQLVKFGQHEGAELAKETVQRANEMAHRVADYSRNEGAAIARDAALRALRTGRALKADPVPIIVGAVGIALLANLLFGRRSHRNENATRS